jgi:hypothetical protein
MLQALAELEVLKWIAGLVGGALVAALIYVVVRSMAGARDVPG